MLNRKTAALAAGAAFLLAACGGGDDYHSAPPDPAPAPVTAVPDSAVVSSSALVTYLKAGKVDDESAEALTLPLVDLAMSETEEPQTL